MLEGFCGCEEHVQLGPLALVLHQQGIGCDWHRVSERNRKHMVPLGGDLVEEVYDAGPFPHDGWVHRGDHEIVAAAIRTT